MSEPDRYLTETGMLVNAADALIDPQKLLGYSLDPDHSRGGDEALVLKRVLRYNRVNAGELAAGIRTWILSTPARFRGHSECGAQFSVDLLMSGPTGRQAILRTGWIYRPGEPFPGLTTAFVRRRRSGAKATIS